MSRYKVYKMVITCNYGQYTVEINRTRYGLKGSRSLFYKKIGLNSRFRLEDLLRRYYYETFLTSPLSGNGIKLIIYNIPK